MSEIFAIAGATCTGKTDLSLRLVDRYRDFEIVSVDSVMIYRGFDIGSAKPSTDILAKYPHHLIDVRDFTQDYDLGTFFEDCERIVSDILARGKKSLLVGGTMMYFYSLVKGIQVHPPSDKLLAESLLREAREKGLNHLYDRLKSLEPSTKIHSNDQQRILRRLNILHSEQNPVLSVKRPSFNLRMIALTPKNRSDLDPFIHARTRAVLKLGLIREVEHLLEKARDLEVLPKIFSAITYKQAVDFLQGLIDSERELYDRIFWAIRRLAKAQMTWLSHKFADKISVDFLDPDLDGKVAKIMGL